MNARYLKLEFTNLENPILNEENHPQSNEVSLKS